MATLRETINELEKRLKEKRKSGNIGPKQTAILNSIENGSLTGPQLGLILQGASFGFSDELIGYLPRPGLNPIVQTLQNQGDFQFQGNMPFPGSDSPDFPDQVATEIERRTLDQYREENPVSALALEAAGGLPSGFFGAARFGLAKGAALGAGSGGLSGLGTAEGNLGERLPEAAVGAAVGTFAAPALDLAARGAQNVYRSLFMTGSRKRAGTEQARAQVAQAIRAEGMEPNEAVAMMAQQEGVPVTLADLGTNTQALIDATSVLPGPGATTARNYLRRRREGRYTRLGTIMQDSFGQRANFYNDFQALKAGRESAAGPLYKRAYRQNVEVGEELNDLFRRPTVQEAVNRGLRIAADKGQLEGPVAGLRLNDAGDLVNANGERVDQVNARFLHIVKMGLDDVAFPKIPQQGIGAEQINTARAVRRQFLELFDNEVPEYARARALYSTDSRIMDAMQLGRDVTARTDTDELAANVRDMSPSEKEAFSLGVLQNIEDQAARSVEGANTAYNVYKTPQKRRVLRLAFPEGEQGQKQYDQFIGALETEARMATTESRVLGGSQTAERTEAMRMLREGADVPTLSSMDPGQIVMQLFREEGQQASEAQLRSATAEMARLLTEEDPAALARIARDLGSMSLRESIVRNTPRLAARLPLLLAGQLRDPVQTGAIAERTASEILNQNQNRIAQ